MKRYTFQVNLHHSPNHMSACGELGLIYAPNLIGLVRRIQKEFNLKVEQIVLTFQEE